MSLGTNPNPTFTNSFFKLDPFTTVNILSSILKNDLPYHDVKNSHCESFFTPISYQFTPIIYWCCKISLIINVLMVIYGKLAAFVEDIQMKQISLLQIPILKQVCLITIP